MDRLRHRGQPAAQSRLRLRHAVRCLGDVGRRHAPAARAITLLLATWLGNQAIGFGLMHYPWTASTLGWGIAIGAATFAAWGSALGAGRLGPAPLAIRTGIGLAAAFAAYELTLLFATLFLPSGHGAFAGPVVLRIFAINAVALMLLLVARRLADVAGIVVPGHPASQRG